MFPNFEEQAQFAWLAGDRRVQSAGLKSVQRRGSGTDFDQLIDYRGRGLDPVTSIGKRRKSMTGRSSASFRTNAIRM